MGASEPAQMMGEKKEDHRAEGGGAERTRTEEGVKPSEEPADAAAVAEDKGVVEVAVSKHESAGPPPANQVVGAKHPHIHHPPVTPIQIFPTPAAETRSVRPPPHLQPPPGAGGQPSMESLNSRWYTNRISLAVFLLHLLCSTAGICFFSFKAVQGALGGLGVATQRREIRALTFWLPPISGSAVLGIILSFCWQKALRHWPQKMVRFILWFSFGSTMVCGVLLLCISVPSTVGLGVLSIFFSIGTSLYACWVTHRIKFAAVVLSKSLEPAKRFHDLNHPMYLMLVAGFLWISVWCFAVIGALNFHYPPLTILAMVVSLMWTAEVLRNVANLTVSRVIALYYLRGMQSSTKFCFQRASSRNLGSACLGSLFVPTIEACRIIARGLNLLEGEDEFMFSCAHCCLRIMEAVFRYGNSWAFVHTAAYGKGFVAASQSTWGLFERAGMEPIVDADITSSICFLSGISSGAVCAIFAASWVFGTYKKYTATVFLLAFFVGYLMTRIGMAMIQACVACYYVCYAENPSNRLFDSTIPDRIQFIKSGRDVMASTPRFPRRFTTTT